METIATNVERELKRVNSRPADLPEFRAPPLSEFVVGVQFAPIPGYSSIDARAIWELFRSEFPIVQEQTPLPPQFETFGGGQSSGFQIQFGTVAGPMRLWFVGEQNNHLLQFQPDRFLLNWRRSDQGSYPRYEVIADRFQELLCALKNHVSSAKSHELDINQIEITYLNIIPVEGVSELSKWLKVGPAFEIPVETMNMNFTEVIRNEDGNPLARLHHSLRSVVSMDGSRNAFQLDLTYRGKPTNSGIDGAFELIGRGRVAIVNRFAELTTNEAHDVWGMTI